LRTALDRGRLIVGTGSTNPPWHFEDDKGNLTGMDIAMARILAKGLFDDETKVDIVIQFMTISSSRAQLVAFSRPYYIEGSGLMVTPKSKYKTYKELLTAG